jgi:hypothetical protein
VGEGLQAATAGFPKASWKFLRIRNKPFSCIEPTGVSASRMDYANMIHSFFWMPTLFEGSYEELWVPH